MGDKKYGYRKGKGVAKVDTSNAVDKKHKVKAKKVDTWTTAIDPDDFAWQQGQQHSQRALDKHYSEKKRKKPKKSGY